MTKKDAIRVLFSEILNKGRHELRDDLIDPEYLEHDPLPGQLPGAERIRNKLKAFTRSFPDLQSGLEDVLAK